MLEEHYKNVYDVRADLLSWIEPPVKNFLFIASVFTDRLGREGGACGVFTVLLYIVHV